MTETDQSAAGGKFNLARISIERPVLTWLIILFCLLGGLLGFLSVGRLEDPAFTIKQAIVFTPYPGATAEEVENEVTERLETAIQQMSQLDEVYSQSSPGMSEIHVTIRDEYKGADLPQIWDELRKRIRDAAPNLPPGAGSSSVVDDYGDVYGILFAVITPDYSDREVRDIADTLRRELLVVDGVSKVELSGVPQERIYIEMSQEDLSRLGLSVEAVLSTVSNENSVVSAGETPSGDRLIRIEMPQSIGGVESIENLLISPRDAGPTLRLSDIAQVTRAPVERDQLYVYHNGERAFTLGISGLADANIVDVGAAVEARLAELAPDLPVGVELKPIYEQHTIVEASINGFLVNLAMSVIIVVGMLCLFMGWRAGVTVGVVLLLTVLGTLFFMYMFDITMQRISLGALIIAMGMLVDNAIVVTEGIQVSVQRGEDRMKAAENAVSSTQWPLMGATVIGIMAFSGIGMSPDTTGEFMFSLFVVIGISLLLSWVLAITVAPMVAYHLFKGDKAVSGDPYGSGIYVLYRGLLVGLLKRRILTVLVLVGLFIGSIVGFGSVRQAFFPYSSTPMFFIDVRLPQGADILQTDEVVRDIARYAGDLDNIQSIDALVGRGASRFMLTYTSEQPNAAYGQLIIQTESLKEIPSLSEAIMAYIQETYPQLEARSKRIVFGPSSDAQLEARFMGPDVEVLRSLADEALQRLSEDGSFTELRTDWRNRELVLTPQVLPDRARTIGVTRGDIADALSYATTGSQVGVFREGNVLIPIIARAPEGERDQPSNLTDRLIWSPSQNAYVPIGQVVSGFELEAHEGLIQRRNRVRTMTVQASTSGEDVTAASAFPHFAEVITAMELPHGYTLEWGGEHDVSQTANESLGGVLPLSFIVMLVISFLLFQSVRQPLIIWLIVPMSICGVTIGLLVTNVAFSFTALLGLLSLSGMLIKNAIVLVDEVDQRINMGEPRFDALVVGSVSRLRPVLLAAGTTILGMAPLIFDAFFQGMAVTIVSGLAFATVLTMIVTPIFYALFFRIKDDEAAGAA